MLTENIQMTNFVTDLKTITTGIIFKKIKEAAIYETLASKKAADIYIGAIENGDLWASYITFDYDVLEEAGIPTESIEACMESIDNIPYALRTKCMSLQKTKTINNYVEQNNYYRMLHGVPDVDDTDYLYMPDNTYGIPTTTPVHLLSDSMVNIAESKGLIASLLADNPTKLYLNHLSSKKVDYRTARNALNYEILYLPSISNSIITTEFAKAYSNARAYFMISMYNPDLSAEFEWYDEFMGLSIMIMAIQRTVANIYDQGLTRDFYDPELIRYLFNSYSVPYIEGMSMDLKKNIAKNLNLLLMYKSTDKVLYDISYIMGFYDINIYKYYLVKDHVLDTNGNPVFPTKVVDGVTIPDYLNMYTFHFQKVNLKTTDLLVAKTDAHNNMTYDSLTGADNYWIDDEELMNKLYTSKFNSILTKYMSMDVSIRLVEMLYESCHTIRMILDDNAEYKYITTDVSALSTAPVSLFNLVLFICAMGAKKFGLEGGVPLQGYPVANIYGFNFTADLTAIQMDIKNHVGDYKYCDDSVLNYIVTMTASTADDVSTMYNNITALRKIISKAMTSTNDQNVYRSYSKLYHSLLTTEDSKSVYVLPDGNTAKTYAELLKGWAPDLYSTYESITTDSEFDDLINACFVAISKLNDQYYYIKSIYKSNVVYEYILKFLKFLKSYTVDFVNSGLLYVCNDPTFFSIKLTDQLIHGIESFYLYHGLPVEGRNQYVDTVRITMNALAVDSLNIRDLLPYYLVDYNFRKLEYLNPHLIARDKYWISCNEEVIKQNLYSNNQYNYKESLKFNAVNLYHIYSERLLADKYNYYIDYNMRKIEYDNPRLISDREEKNQPKITNYPQREFLHIDRIDDYENHYDDYPLRDNDSPIEKLHLISSKMNFSTIDKEDKLIRQDKLQSFIDTELIKDGHLSMDNAIPNITASNNYKDTIAVIESIKAIAETYDLTKIEYTLPLIAKDVEKYGEAYNSGYDRILDDGIDEHTAVYMDGNSFVDSGYSKTMMTTKGTVILNDNSGYGGVYEFTAGNSGIIFPYTFKGDYTIDFWVKFNSFSDVNLMFSNYNDTTNGEISIACSSSGTLMTAMTNDDARSKITWSGHLFVINTWCHVALVKTRKYQKIYLNGIFVGNVAVLTGDAIQSSSNFVFGGERANRSYSMDGQIDNFRISDYARWTSDFQVPVRRYMDTIHRVSRQTVTGTDSLLTTDGTIDTKNLLALTVDGNSTQTGTPTISAPIDIVSVGDSGSVTITGVGKNLCPVSSAYGNTSRPAGTIIFPISGKSSLIYTASFYAYWSSTNKAVRNPPYYNLGIYYNDGTSDHTRIYDGIEYDVYKKYTISVTATKPVIKIRVQPFCYDGELKGTLVDNSDYFDHMQVEINDVATDYEPYVSDSETVTISQPLYAVPSNSDKLYIDCSNSKIWIAHNCYKLDLNDSTTYRGSFYYYLPTNSYRPNSLWIELLKGRFSKIDKTIVSTYFHYYTVFPGTEDGGATFGNNAISNFSHFLFTVASLTTLAEYKTWIANQTHSVDVIYELADTSKYTESLTWSDNYKKLNNPKFKHYFLTDTTKTAMRAVFDYTYTVVNPFIHILEDYTIPSNNVSLNNKFIFGNTLMDYTREEYANNRLIRDMNSCINSINNIDYKEYTKMNDEIHKKTCKGNSMKDSMSIRDSTSYIVNEAPLATASASGVLTITDASNNPIQMLTISGNSVQTVTTQGKNLWDPKKETLTSITDTNGVYTESSANVNSLEHVRVGQYNGSTFINATYSEALTTLDTIYTITITIVTDCNIIKLYAQSSQVLVSTFVVSLPLDATAGDKYTIQFRLLSLTPGATSFDQLQLEKASTATTYEAYIPDSPSPNYPATISSVCEDTTSLTIAATGKNLCPAVDSGEWVLSGGAYIDDDGWIVFPSAGSVYYDIPWGCRSSYFGVQYEVENSTSEQSSILCGGQYYTNTGRLDGNGWAPIITANTTKIFSKAFGAQTPSETYSKAIANSTYIRFIVSPYLPSTGTLKTVYPVRFRNVMITDATQYLPSNTFEPYRGKSITIPLSTPLRGITGDNYRDTLTIDVVNKSVNITRNIGVCIPSSTYGFGLCTYAINNGVFGVSVNHYMIADINMSVRTYSMSNIAPSFNINGSLTSRNTYQATGSVQFSDPELDIDTTTLTVAQALQYLINWGALFQYVTNTTTETLTWKDEYADLLSYAELTTISINSSVPATISATYIQS